VKSAEAQRINKVLKMLAQFEMGLFEFYSASLDHYGPGSEFLVQIVQDEILHAENVAQMVDRLATNPDKFEKGRPLDTSSISSALAGLKNNQQRLEKGDLTAREILSASREMEIWLLGVKYPEIVKTDDVEYRALVREIVSQTEEHKKILGKKLQEMGRQKSDRVVSSGLKAALKMEGVADQETGKDIDDLRSALSEMITDFPILADIAPAH
jgi:bacterioferritin (cytochrome b1)